MKEGTARPGGPASSDGGEADGGQPGDTSAERLPQSPSNSKADPESADAVFYCDLCGNIMLNLHCKLICERCGYKRDCSDP